MWLNGCLGMRETPRFLQVLAAELVQVEGLQGSAWAWSLQKLVKMAILDVLQI